MKSSTPPQQFDVVFYPTIKLGVPWNKKNVLESGLWRQKTGPIVDYIDIDLKKRATQKPHPHVGYYANKCWKRPIYFSEEVLNPAE